MKYAIISDIHNNLEALLVVLESCHKQHVDQIICAGDIVGYAANPSECLQQIYKNQIQSVAGNHDWATCGRLDATYFNAWGQAGVAYSRQMISLEDHEFLASLPLIHQNEEFVVVHGTLNDPEKFTYLCEIEQTPEIFDLMEQPICFVGHTHQPEIYLKHQDHIYFSRVLETEVNPEDKYIVNVGSVGQPRDGIPLASFCIYDNHASTLMIQRLPYDITVTQKKIMAAGLPDYLAQRLAIGQ